MWCWFWRCGSQPDQQYCYRWGTWQECRLSSLSSRTCWIRNLEVEPSNLPFNSFQIIFLKGEVWEPPIALLHFYYFTLRQGSSTAALLSFGADNSLSSELLVHCNMFSSILCLYPLDTSSNFPPPPSQDNQNCLQILPNPL